MVRQKVLVPKDFFDQKNLRSQIFFGSAKIFESKNIWVRLCVTISMLRYCRFLLVVLVVLVTWDIRTPKPLHAAKSL